MSGPTPPSLPVRRLGGSGLYVSELGLGTMTLSTDGKGGWGLPVASEEDSHAILDAYVAAGGNFLDTANVYGTSEECIGRWLAKREKADPKFRQSIVIATKFGNPMGTGPNERGGSRKHIEDSVAASLHKLQTSYIDLYQVHVWIPDTPLTELLFALDSLVRRGSVRYLGCSNFTSWQLNEAARLVQEHHLTPFVTLQQQYSLMCRTLEWDTIDVLEKDNVGILPWSPLAGGWLSGRIKRGQKEGESGSRVAWAEAAGWRATDFSSNANEAAFKIIDALEAVGAEVKQPVAAVALRWLLQRKQVSSVLIGARSIQQLHDNLRASSFSLTEQQMKKLTDASKTPLPYPFNLQKERLMGKDE